jgi:hypothetical protein
LTNRYVANQAAAKVAKDGASADPISTASQASGSASAGSASAGSASSGQSAAGKRQQTPAADQDNEPLPPEKPRQPLNTLSPPPLPHDGGHGHGITIRFNLPE